MKNEYIREFLCWAIPCFTHPKIYSRERKEYIRTVWPKIKRKVLNGKINEKILKFWYSAYPFFKRNVERGMKNPMKEYMFKEHNEFVAMEFKRRKKISKCLAMVGVVISGKNYLIVDVLGKRKRVKNSCNAKRGDYVGIHIGEAVEIIDRKEYVRYLKLLKKYSNIIFYPNRT